MSTKRQTATDGTQAHRDLATVKNNINYWIKVHGMDREEAKARVNQPSYVMMDAQTINREVAAEAKRQANLKARQEREAEQQRKDQEQQRKEEPKTDESKGEKKINQRQIGITVNGVVYQSICKGMAAVGIQDKGTKNWFKIRADLKKSGISIFGEFTFIQL
jgi:TPP-dependent indolepyruvate ferredoxin oxidoreductase alpha subunit